MDFITLPDTQIDDVSAVVMRKLLAASGVEQPRPGVWSRRVNRAVTWLNHHEVDVYECTIETRHIPGMCSPHRLPKSRAHWVYLGASQRGAYGTIAYYLVPPPSQE